MIPISVLIFGFRYINFCSGTNNSELNDARPKHNVAASNSTFIVNRNPSTDTDEDSQTTCIVNTALITHTIKNLESVEMQDVSLNPAGVRLITEAEFAMIPGYMKGNILFRLFLHVL